MQEEQYFEKGEKMAETNISVTTVKGRSKLCKAQAGLATLPKIAQMAWGNGGIGEDGNPKIPTGNEENLYNRLLIKNITSVTLINDDETTARYTATIEKGELTGEKISEVGLFDAEGDLVQIRTFSEKEKDDDIPLTFDIDAEF
jgi:phage-related tail fiber protein